jgi:hypothetical protein
VLMIYRSYTQLLTLTCTTLVLFLIGEGLGGGVFVRFDFLRILVF